MTFMRINKTCIPLLKDQNMKNINTVCGSMGEALTTIPGTIHATKVAAASSKQSGKLIPHMQFYLKAT